MASSPSTSLLLRQMRAHHAAAPSSPAASAAAAAPLQAASAAAVVSPLPMTPTTMATSSSPCPLPPGRRPRGGLGGSAGPSTPLAAATTQQQQQQAPTPTPTSRFPVRVFLSAYMMRSHPEVVFSSIGPDEAALAHAATAMLAAFESACAAFSSSSSSATGEATTPFSTSNIPTRQRLERLDDAWAEYHALFRAWRLGDAAQLEREIVEMACRLEVSMLRKVGVGPASPLYEARLAASPDLQSLVRQVQGDRQLLRARLARVSGRAGVARMDAALEEARAAVGAEMEQQQQAMAMAAAAGATEQR